MKEQETLEAESFCSLYEQVNPPICIVFRSHEKFVNHLYMTSSHVADLIFAYNTKSGKCTLSRRDDSVKKNCNEIMKIIFGDKAGGSPGIAGSPRGEIIHGDEYCIAKGELIAMV